MTLNSNGQNFAKIAAASSALFLFFPRYQLNGVENESLVLENVRDGLKSNISLNLLREFLRAPVRFVNFCRGKLQLGQERIRNALITMKLRMTMREAHYDKLFSSLPDQLEKPDELLAYYTIFPKLWNTKVMMLVNQPERLNKLTRHNLRTIILLTTAVSEGFYLKTLLKAITKTVEFPIEDKEGNITFSLLLRVMKQIQNSLDEKNFSDRFLGILKAVANDMKFDSNTQKEAVENAKTRCVKRFKDQPHLETQEKEFLKIIEDVSKSLKS